MRFAAGTSGICPAEGSGFRGRGEILRVEAGRPGEGWKVFEWRQRGAWRIHGWGDGEGWRWQPGGCWTPSPPFPAPASPAAGGALRGKPFSGRGGLAHAAPSLQALSPGLSDLGRVGHVGHSALGFRGDPAAPGAAIAAGRPPAAAAAGARQADFLLPPEVPVAQGRQVSAAAPAAPPRLGAAAVSGG